MVDFDAEALEELAKSLLFDLDLEDLFVFLVESDRHDLGCSIFRILF